MNLLVAPGISVVEVAYAISKSGQTDITGTIAVPDDDDIAQATIFGLTQGAGYALTLSAVSTDGKYTCKGQSEFSVIAGQSTTVGVDLQCRSEDGTVGGVIGKGTFNVCPNISSYTVSPDTAQIGDTIALSASATDPNTGDTLTFKWSGGGGGFAPATGSKTAYTCGGSPGKQTLSVTVTDGKCEDVQAIVVTCLEGGSGTGGASGTGGTVSTGGTTGGTEPTGGTVSTGGTTGGTGGGRPVGPVCDECSQNSFVQEAVQACENAPNATEAQLCIDYIDCARVNNCVLPGLFDESGCFCGYTDPNEGPNVAVCFGTQGAAFGPCLQQVVAAAGSSDISDINEAWILPDSPLGRANELLRRQMEICSDDGAGGECFPYH